MSNWVSCKTKYDMFRCVMGINYSEKARWGHFGYEIEDKIQILCMLFVQIRVVFLQWLPWFLRMSRPGDKITLKTMAATAKMRDQIREIELKERSSKSLLANVLGKTANWDQSLKLEFFHRFFEGS